MLPEFKEDAAARNELLRTACEFDFLTETDLALEVQNRLVSAPG
jgi:hypothetical protein